MLDTVYNYNKESVDNDEGNDTGAMTATIAIALRSSRFATSSIMRV